MVNINNITSSQTNIRTTTIENTRVIGESSPVTENNLISDNINADITKTCGKIPANDNILFLGMNPGHEQEIKQLKKANIIIDDISNSENWKVDKFDLKTEGGVSDFINSLGLSNEDQKKELKSIILDIDAGNINQVSSARDEAAELIKEWSKAENGAEIPSRFVISGHGNSITIWGDNDKGHIEIASINRIAQVMPKAASQIEDILISACRCGYKDTIEGFKNKFPNLKTVWGYAGTAPLGEYGGTKHVQEWEIKTRGHNSKIDRKEELNKLKGTSEYQNIAMWSKEGGYQRGKADNSANFVETWMRLERYREGSFDSNNIQNDLNNLYNTIQDLNSVALPEYKPIYKLAIEKVNILRHFPEVVSKFDAVLGNDIKEAFKIANVECPDLKANDKNTFITQFMKKSSVFLALYDSHKFDTFPENQKKLLQKVANIMNQIVLLNNDFITQEWLTSDLTVDIKNKILNEYNK